MKRRRVVVLTHEDAVPPTTLSGLSDREKLQVKREFHVVKALRELGHEVRVLGVAHELVPIRELVEEWKPHVVFNLLIEFQDEAAYQMHIASYLELLKVPYTGCNPRGLLLARDKALSKKIFRFHRIPSPAFAVFRRGRRFRMAPYARLPLIVKSVDEDASMGVSQASIVRDEEQLRERVEFVHRTVGTDALAEEYIEGRELTIAVLGNQRLTTFPVWEMFFKKLPEGTEPIATHKVKWDPDYQKKVGIGTGRAKNLSQETETQIASLARRVYRALDLSGFARMDLRLTDAGRIYVIEANATPDLSRDEDLAESAKAAGLAYPELLQRIVGLGIARG
ncbi:MAG: ATP-grasp domain-containing protein [Proteobacteria bacterium]|nr:ATP-grasp domain-containing protein [Pseudomonadota bacterium]